MGRLTRYFNPVFFYIFYAAFYTQSVADQVKICQYWGYLICERQRTQKQFLCVFFTNSHKLQLVCSYSIILHIVIAIVVWLFAKIAIQGLLQIFYPVFYISHKQTRYKSVTTTFTVFARVNVRKNTFFAYCQETTITYCLFFLFCCVFLL